jgi:superfamily II DNA or RNA helicase
MMELSSELSSKGGMLYQHDGYQVTVAASAVYFKKMSTIVELTTGGGKTMVGGLIYQYCKTVTDESVIIVVPNEELRVQMIN